MPLSIIQHLHACQSLENRPFERLQNLHLSRYGAEKMPADQGRQLAGIPRGLHSGRAMGCVTGKLSHSLSPFFRLREPRTPNR